MNPRLLRYTTWELERLPPRPLVYKITLAALIGAAAVIGYLFGAEAAAIASAPLVSCA